MPNKTYGIYLPLDCVLDTRLGCLYQNFGESISVQMAVSKKYASRKEDSFAHITREQFKQVYDKRDKQTLANSISTKLIDYIRETCLSVKYRVSAAQENKDPVIFLNLYPYKDISEEEREVIKKYLSMQFANPVEIKIIDMPDRELNYLYVTSNFDIMFMYDYGPFIDTHIKDVESKKFQKITLFGPGIFHNGLPDKETDEKIRKTNMSPWKLVEISLSAAIEVRLIDIDFFNANIVS